MGWGSSWDDTANGWNSKVSVNIIKEETRPYSQILREHNSAAEAQMKAAAITKTGQETLMSMLPIITHIDMGKNEKSAVCIMRGNEILAMGESVELNIPVDWNTYKANALQIGDLAVVISTNDPEDHCLVHVPTQTWFDNAVPNPNEQEFTVEQLCLWAWKVQQEFKTCWYVLRSFDNRNYKEIKKSDLDALREYCLSIKVE